MDILLWFDYCVINTLIYSSHRQALGAWCWLESFECSGMKPGIMNTRNYADRYSRFFLLSCPFPTPTQQPTCGTFLYQNVTNWKEQGTPTQCYLALFSSSCTCLCQIVDPWCVFVSSIQVYLLKCKFYIDCLYFYLVSSPYSVIFNQSYNTDVNFRHLTSEFHV